MKEDRSSVVNALGAYLMSRCVLGHRNFSNRNLCNIVARDKNFVDVDFSNSSLKGSDFRYSTFINCNFANCDLTDSFFYGASIYESCLASAVLKGSDLTYCSFGRNDFRGAALSNVKLYRTSLNDCKFSGGVESYLYLHGAQGVNVR